MNMTRDRPSSFNLKKNREKKMTKAGNQDGPSPPVAKREEGEESEKRYEDMCNKAILSASFKLSKILPMSGGWRVLKGQGLVQSGP